MDNEKNQQSQDERQDPPLSPSSRREESLETGVSRREFMSFAAASIFFAHAHRQAPPSDSRNGIPYRTLGRTREKVSLIGLGGYHLGKQADQQESIRIIRTGLDEGLNFLDNCW